MLLLFSCADRDDRARSADGTPADSVSTAASPADSDAAAATACSTPRRAGALPDALREASGIAVSRSDPGVLWLHNDSDEEPIIYAADTAGALLATVRVAGATSADWEDIAVGDCPAGDCIYLAAIGDNYHERDDRGFYRFEEPDRDARRTAAADFFPFRYPDAPRDAEALFVMPGGEVFIISKGRDGPVAVYRYGVPDAPDSVRTLEPVQQLTTGIVQLPQMVTAAGATPDGAWIAVRTYSALHFYSMRDGHLAPALDSAGVDLRPLGEFQGEGADIRADGAVFLASEKGLDENPAPPLSILRCRLDRLRK